jgi:hypothetical protein
MLGGSGMRSGKVFFTKTIDMVSPDFEDRPIMADMNNLVCDR